MVLDEGQGKCFEGLMQGPPPGRKCQSPAPEKSILQVLGSTPMQEEAWDICGAKSGPFSLNEVEGAKKLC